MDAAQRELNDQIDQATQRLLDDARTIPEAELRTPSLLPGWTRAHVLAHVARGADAMRNLLIGARSGQDRAAYASAQSRDADIEQGAAMGAKDLMADLAGSAMALRTIVRQLPDQAWQVRVRVLDSAPFPAAELLTRRLVEVELHHCDLGVGYSPVDWPAAFAAMELAEPMRSQRQDRLRYPSPSPTTMSGFAARSPAPWKPGQRLPGSWLGKGDQSKGLPVPPGPGPIPVRDDRRDLLEVQYACRTSHHRETLGQFRGRHDWRQRVIKECHMFSFRHATVLACTGADPVYDATVIVEGAVIKDIVTGTRSAAGADGEVIDCAGRTVMPGLIDAHVHVCAVEVDLAAQRRNYPTSLLAYTAATMIGEALDQGFTTVRDAGGADWGMKEAVDRGLIRGPRMFVSGHPLSQSGGHGDSRTRAENYAGCGCGAEIGMLPNIADGVDEVRRAVRTQLRRGADAIKVMAGGGVASPTDQLECPQYQPDELSAAVAEAEAAGTYVLAHAYTPVAIRNAVQAGVRSIEHGNFLDEATAKLMAARGTFLVPTFVTYEKLHEQGRERGLTAAQLAKLDLVLGSGLDALGRAREAGVRIGSGSDLLGPLARHKARELAIKASVLGAHETLIATTRTNAELLGIAAETGTIEPGKRADLLVVDGDPLADIAVLQHPDNLKAIVQAGQFHKRQM